MDFDQKELMNEYIQKQNRMIGELINKNLMLDAQYTVALKSIESLKSKLAKYEDKNKEQAYN